MSARAEGTEVAEMEEEASVASLNAPDDWLEHVDTLPDRPRSLIEERFKQYFSTDVDGRKGHDMYVNVLPNGVCVVGLAPSHPLIQQHRQPPVPAAGTPGMHAGITETEAPAPAEQAELGAAPCSSITQEEAAVCELAPSCSAKQSAQPAPEQPPEGEVRVTAGHTQAGKRSRHNRDGHEAVEDAGWHGHGLAQVDSFPMEQLKGINFEVGRHSRMDVKDSGKKKASPGTVMKPGSCLCRVESSQGQCVHVPAAIPGRLLEVNSRLMPEPSLLFNKPCREGYLAILYPNGAELRQLQQQLLPLDQYLLLRGVSAEDFH